MIALFLLTAGASMATLLLAVRWRERRQRAAGLQRVTGKKAAAKEPARTAAPVLIEGPVEERARLARQVLARFRLRERLDHLLDTADLKWGSVGLIHRSAAASFGFSCLVLLLTRNSLPLLTLAALVLGAAAPIQWVRRRARRRIRQFEEQFPECLEFISRSMRAGHAFSVSLEMVHQEFSDPLAAEFRRTFEEQNLGQPLDIVLKKLVYRIPSLDVQFFVSAVLLQKRTGGNLAELLDKLAGIIRERFKLRARVRAISAQGLLSGRILSAIPVAVGGLMFCVNPQYARFFVSDPTGRQMLLAALSLQGIGYLIIKKIVTFEV